MDTKTSPKTKTKATTRVKIAAVSFFLITALGIAGYPYVEKATQKYWVATGGALQPPVVPVVPQIASPKIDVVFVLDTTGSMSGLINAAKEKIWSIADSMASAEAAPEIRVGLVAFRDRGDAYVTQRVDLSADLDSMYATLIDFQAQGGGDTPESVNAALADAVRRMSWSQDPNTYRAVFLVGDSPGHNDYANDTPYPELLREANARGIVVNTIRCGDNPHTETQWRHIASLTQGEYFSVDQAGSAIAVTTPFDGAIAALSKELDETIVVTGSRAEREVYRDKLDAAKKIHAKTSTASRARRAAFNASASGAGNRFGDDELIDAVASGRVELGEVAEAELPEELKVMAPAVRADFVQKRVTKRQALNAQMRTLMDKRDTFIAEEVAPDADASRSLDYQIFSTVKKQAAEKGLVYESAAPKL